MPNYANSKIYKIWSISTDEIYIGSTTQTLSKRIGGHRTKYKSYQNGKYRYITSFKILEYGDAKIELIEKFECKCKDELTAREGYYIRKMECVNKVIPGRTQKQYYLDNKEQLKQYYKQYHKQYRLDNKEQLKQYHKQYDKQYYQTNKEKFKEKLLCECGCSIRKCNLPRHKRTAKHRRLLNQIKE
jgi:hypothetical protein